MSNESIEQRARELLAKVHAEAGWPGCEKEILRGAATFDVDHDLAMAALVAALTPPEGYVLVPVEPTEAMLAAGGDAEQIHVEWGVDPHVANSVEVWAAMLAARPGAA